MASMDFRLARDDRGVSVFWHILGMGAGTFGILALVLILAEAGGEELPYDGGAEVIVQGGEDIVVGRGNSEAASPETDPTLTGDTVTVSGPLEEGELPVENVDVDVTAGDPVDGALVDADDEAVLDANGIPVEAGDATAEAGGIEADQEDLVVDPDGTTAPVVPTPSGPEGDDGDALSQE